jgi:hypothetical protein
MTNSQFKVIANLAIAMNAVLTEEPMLLSFIIRKFGDCITDVEKKEGKKLRELFNEGKKEYKAVKLLKDFKDFLDDFDPASWLAKSVELKEGLDNKKEAFTHEFTLFIIQMDDSLQHSAQDTSLINKYGLESKWQAILSSKEAKEVCAPLLDIINNSSDFTTCKELCASLRECIMRNFQPQHIITLSEKYDEATYDAVIASCQNGSGYALGTLKGIMQNPTNARSYTDYAEIWQQNSLNYLKTLSSDDSKIELAGSKIRLQLKISGWKTSAPVIANAAELWYKLWPSDEIIYRATIINLLPQILIDK